MLITATLNPKCALLHSRCRFACTPFPLPLPLPQVYEGKAHGSSGSGFVTLGDIFSFPMDTSGTADASASTGASASASSQKATARAVAGTAEAGPTLRVECASKGFFAPSYGRAYIAKTALFADAAEMEALGVGGAGPFSEVADIPIRTHTVTLDHAAESLESYTLVNTHLKQAEAAVAAAASLGGASTTAGGTSTGGSAGGAASAGVEPVSVRLLTMVVVGTVATFERALARREAKVSETIAERKTVI